MDLSCYLSASCIFFTLLLSNLIRGGLSDDCTWSYIARPPVASFSQFPPPVFCDPFDPRSSLTLPCQVRGPSQVDINWYFVTPGNGEELLMNSTTHTLISSIIDNGNSVTVSVNVTFNDIQESVDNGTYVCRARVSDMNKMLSPSVQFDIQHSVFEFPCDSNPIRDVDPLCAMLEDIPPASSIVSSHYVPVQNMTTAYTVSPSSTPAKAMTASNHLLSSHHYVSATPSFTQTGHTPLASPAPHTGSTHPTLVPPVATTSDGDLSRTSATPPVNTWFYLLSVVVVLTFLMIILVLILVIFCIMKRGGRRHLVHFPSPQEEIRIQRTGRLPSDPLPRIGNNMASNNCSRLDTNTFRLSTLPQNQLSFIHSAPAGTPPGNHATSLQHLSFNLGPSFQSNSMLYDEIGPPSSACVAPDIRRHSLDYVNRWQFTLESDSSSSSYAIPPDAYYETNSNSSHTEQSGTNCINDRTGVDAIVTVTDDSEGSMSSVATTTTTSCMWLSNTPVTITQCDRSPWGHRDTFGDGGMFPLSPLESSEVSRSPLSSEDLPEGFSESETDENSSLSSIPCVVVHESHTPSDQNKNTLSGQTFELDSNDCVRERIQPPVPESPPTLHHFPPFFPIARNSSTSKITRQDEREYLQTLSNCSRGDSPPDSLLDGRGTDGDNSRSSSSSSGCTDISKYSGDYDRDPAYMRLLLGQVRPLLPGNASPEMLNEDYNGQERADSGMASLYREALSPTGGLPVSTCIGNLYRSTHSSGQYKSLNSLTLEAESMYVRVCHNQHCHCRLFQRCCTD